MELPSSSDIADSEGRDFVVVETDLQDRGSTPGSRGTTTVNAEGLNEEGYRH